MFAPTLNLVTRVGFKCENLQTLTPPWTLGDLSLVLRVVNEGLLHYTIWPVSTAPPNFYGARAKCYRNLKENCWFFCSILQEQFGAEGGGKYVTGGPLNSSLAPQSRALVTTRIQKIREGNEVSQVTVDLS